MTSDGAEPGSVGETADADLHGVEAEVASAVDVGALVAAVSELVRIESWNGQESAAQEFVADLLRRHEFETDVWEIDLPAVQAHPHASWEIERDRAVGVVGSIGDARGGRILLLNGHVDVVPPGDPSAWRHPPFAGVVADGRVHGRGSLDMKGPLMAGLFALAAIRSAGVRLAGTARLVSVIAEEDGGLGTLASILRGYRGDGAIVMEPTELRVASVQAGCLNFRVRVPGIAAHGAVRAEGVSAFEKLFDLYRALSDLEAERNRGFENDPMYDSALPFPISIGTLAGGDWASSVPDHAMFEGRIGVRPDEDLEGAKASLEGAVVEASASDPFLRGHPPTVEWWGGRFLPAACAADHPLVEALTGAAQRTLGGTSRPCAVPFGADAGLMQHVGDTPTVLFGAGDIRGAHRPDEWVSVDELAVMAQTLAVAAVRFCGVSGAS